MKVQAEEGEKKIRVMVGGGGTGGHLFPGLAVAGEIMKRCGGARILFVTGRKEMEAETVRRSGFEQTSISVEGIKGRGWRGGPALLKLPWSFFQCLGIVRKFKPHLVFGVGGYSSGPVCLAAKALGVPSAIHEQNSYPGITNRLLGRVVDRVFISFEESRAHFRGGPLYLTGNPVREQFLDERPRERKDPRFTVLVVGGSQGARAVNDAVVDALVIMKDRGGDVRVIHQTGPSDYERVLGRYREKGVQGEITAFIEDMAGAYAQADMVVSRAGAGAVFELAALGKPALLIPYPFAANRHQETNARALVKAGGAEMMLQETLSGPSLADAFVTYMENPGVLETMAAAAGKAAMPGAARDIAELLLDMVGQ